MWLSRQCTLYAGNASQHGLLQHVDPCKVGLHITALWITNTVAGSTFQAAKQHEYYNRTIHGFPPLQPHTKSTGKQGNAISAAILASGLSMSYNKPIAWEMLQSSTSFA